MTHADFLATRTQRFIAKFIDNLIVSFLAMVTVFSLSVIIPYEAFVQNISLVFMMALSSVLYALFADSLFFGGQSLGKRLIGIKVILESTKGSVYLRFGTNFVRQITALIPFISLIDAIFIIDSRKQRLGDRLAKTVVVRSNIVIHDT